MIRVIALTQLVFAALGSMAAIILHRSHTDGGPQAHDLHAYISANFMWLLLIPVAWLMVGEGIARFTSSEGVVKAVIASGVLLAVGILVVALLCVFGN